MGNGLLAFAAGMGTGYLNQQQRNREQARQDKFDAQGDEIYSAQKDEREQAKMLRAGLASAAQTAQVEQGAGGMMRPETMDNRDVGLPENDGLPNQGLGLSQFRVNGKSYGARPEADAAAADYNKPEAKQQRIGLAYANAGKPLEALQYQNAAESQQRSQIQFTNEQAAHARKLRDEGVFDATKALRMGDGAGMVKAFNQSGDHRIDGDPVITQENRDIPGIGRVPTYTAKFRMIGPDGQITEQTRNSHDMSMQIMAYEKALEFGRKGTDSENKMTKMMGDLDMKGKLLDIQGQLYQARIAKAEAGGSDKVSREERLRYTSLFSEAGRRMGDAQKSLNTLLRDPFYSSAEKGSPQYDELQGIRSSIAELATERKTFQSLLSGSQSGEPGPAPGLASAQPKAPKAAAIARPTSAAEHAAIPKGSRYIAPNGQTYVKQ